MKRIKNCLKLGQFSEFFLKAQTLVAVFMFLNMISTISVAYIPDLSFVLKKASKSTGSKIVKIEQEVIFKIGAEEARVDETWIIEGDRNLRLVAQGKNLFKDNIKLNYLYNGKNKTHIKGKNKITSIIGADFYQRYLFTRAKDSFLGYLKELNIPEEVKLSRADGVPSFLIGHPSETVVNPQIWIGQDDFVIRKIRTPSNSEILLGEVAAFPSDVGIARTQTVTWSSANDPLKKHIVFIKIKKIDLNNNTPFSTFYPQNLEIPSELTFVNQTEITQEIEEFYSRFR